MQSPPVEQTIEQLAALMTRLYGNLISTLLANGTLSADEANVIMIGVAAAFAPPDAILRGPLMELTHQIRTATDKLAAKKD